MFYGGLLFVVTKENHCDGDIDWINLISSTFFCTVLRLDLFGYFKIFEYKIFYIIIGKQFLNIFC